MQKDHLEIILEDINSKFDLVLEGHVALDQKIDRKFDQLSEKVDHNSFLIDTLNKKIDGVDERLSKKIDSVEEKLSNKIDAVDTRLSNKIDSVEEKLNQKIDSVEQKLSQKIDGVAADLKAHRVDTEMHHGVYGVKE